MGSFSEIKESRVSNLHFDMLHTQWEQAKTKRKLSEDISKGIVDGDVTIWCWFIGDQSVLWPCCIWIKRVSLTAFRREDDESETTATTSNWYFSMTSSIWDRSLSAAGRPSRGETGMCRLRTIDYWIFVTDKNAWFHSLFQFSLLIDKIRIETAESHSSSFDRPLINTEGNPLIGQTLRFCYYEGENRIYSLLECSVSVIPLSMASHSSLNDVEWEFEWTEGKEHGIQVDRRIVE